eukprot:763566-Hanusia_phi.AAC.2
MKWSLCASVTPKSSMERANSRAPPPKDMRLAAILSEGLLMMATRAPAGREAADAKPHAIAMASLTMVVVSSSRARIGGWVEEIRRGRMMMEGGVGGLPSHEEWGTEGWFVEMTGVND